jgi:TonB family protein
LVRGITFSLTAEIEKELEGTGADKMLIDSIRKKSPIVNTSTVIEPPVETKPAAPPPPDFTFYLNRGNASTDKGDFDSAVIDYGKVLELKPGNVDALLKRGIAYAGKKWFDLAISDFSKVLEIDAKYASAYSHRGESFQKKGDLASAKADYQKALSLDENIEPAKANLAEIVADELKAQQKAIPPPPPVIEKTLSTPPEYLEVGQLTEASFVRKVSPVYPPIAIKANIGGRVRVEVTIDEDGNVVGARAIDGHQFLRLCSEDAARHSRLKPAKYDGRPIKSKGHIIYNYNPAGR